MIKRVISFCTVLSAAGFATPLPAAEHEHKPDPVSEAVAVLVPMKSSGVGGTILLKQEKGSVKVTGEVT